jgi:BirA family biotin operon repressor/biotin-[acetyl-CoA-carboxylase] ligase
MSKHEIQSRLQSKNLNYDVIYLDSVDSTNNFAKNQSGENDLLIVAEKQTAGRGRYGRSFASPFGKGLYFTLVTNTPVQKPALFPLIAATAVSRAVYSVCGIELAIKWPNDLLWLPRPLRDAPLGEGGYRKLCGILTEASPKYIIVGIGLNINNTAEDFPDDIKNKASSLKIITGKEYARSEFFDILCGITGEFTRLLHISSENLLGEYKKRLLLDIDVSFTQDGRIIKGRAAGINNHGNLIAKLENGSEIVIQSGEIGIL